MLAIVIVLLVVLIAVAVVFVVRERSHAVFRATYTATHDDMKEGQGSLGQDEPRCDTRPGGRAAGALLPGDGRRFTAGDWRFLGTPVDFVIFDGLSDGQVERIVLVEVKSGTDAKLNDRQIALRAAVNAGTGRLEWLTVRRPRPAARRGHRSLLPPDAAGPADLQDTG
jgi:hypothetical protein